MLGRETTKRLYGTKWDDVPHGSQQISRPDHKLVFQTTISEDGQWVRRIWANDRVDQDTYNYAIKYSGGSPDHPIYIRTYVEPRDTYTPLPENTPDPVYPSALLVDEEVVRQQNELDSEYVQVVRVYETIPGPAITSKRVNDRGDTETIVTQIVPPGTTPDPDGLLVTGTQVQQERPAWRNDHNGRYRRSINNSRNSINKRYRLNGAADFRDKSRKENNKFNRPIKPF